MSIISRFPPSPTGMMHIGNARTALFNWLLARHHGGKFVVRIEDTDRERHSEEAVQVILDSLEWLGLDYDNTPESQYENKQRHIDIANELLAAGKAYKCYCTPEELSVMREEAKAEGRPTAYDNSWRDKTDADAPDNTPYVIRIKSPLDGDATLHDEVQGDVVIANDHIDDFILLRADGVPTYMLAVVVDDHDMDITHVMRGDDHLNNTFRQNVIYDALGWDKPVYAHLPLIHGPDGAKFSKRHGAVGIGEFKELGYLPEAICNYLLRLGWSHGDDEIISREEAIKNFGFEGMQKSAARFDYKKLESLNAHYIIEADNERLLKLVTPFLKDGFSIDLGENNALKDIIFQAMDMIKERARTLVELAQIATFFCNDPADYDEKAAKQLNADTLPYLNAIQSEVESRDVINGDDLKAFCADLATEHTDGKIGKIMMPLRAATFGTLQSPDLMPSIQILGKETVLRRLENAINYINK